MRLGSRLLLLFAIINTHWHLDHVGGNLLLPLKYPDVAIEEC